MNYYYYCGQWWRFREQKAIELAQFFKADGNLFSRDRVGLSIV